MNKNYWDLTNRPHTERKLQILEAYIYPWARIIFNQWLKKYWKTYKIAYFVDCFAGRGKYHKNEKLNSINGSPLIALECAKFFKEEYKGEVQLKCIFIEKKEQYFSDLRKFCNPYKSSIKPLIIKGDVNEEIDNVLKIINNNAALFFIDPFQLSDLDNQTIRKIIHKKGPNDIILNYICGTNRVIGAIKRMILKNELTNKTYKLIKSIEKFHTLSILKECFNKSDKERLKYWAEQILQNTDLKYKAVYEMMSSSKKEPVYYLLYASRVSVGQKIMKDILRKEDMTEYSGQSKLFCTNNFDL